jgi:AcrR family transcriptional regulator
MPVRHQDEAQGAAERAAGGAAGGATQGATEHTAGRAAERAAGGAAEHTAGRAAERAAQGAAERTTERTTGRARSRKEDRRVAYTRMALRDALVELMRERHISGITVTSICELADVNRSTFYLHYRDQYDLLHQMEHAVLEALEARLQGQQDAQDARPVTLKVMTEILEYARENAALARVLLSENCDFAFQQDIMTLAQILVIWMDPSYSERTRDYIMVYGISGCIAIAERWLKDGMVEQPEEIAHLILQALYSGIGSFAKKP